MCDIDEPGRNTSSALSSRASTALAAIQPSVSSVCVTPFAGPVLPDVKKIAAGALGSVAVCSMPDGDAATSDSYDGPAGSGAPYDDDTEGQLARRAAWPRGRRIARQCATSALAPLTSRAWSISGGAYR